MSFTSWGTTRYPRPWWVRKPGRPSCQGAAKRDQNSTVGGQRLYLAPFMCHLPFLVHPASWPLSLRCPHRAAVSAALSLADCAAVERCGEQAVQGCDHRVVRGAPTGGGGGRVLQARNPRWCCVLRSCWLAQSLVWPSSCPSDPTPPAPSLAAGATRRRRSRATSQGSCRRWSGARCLPRRSRGGCL